MITKNKDDIVMASLFQVPLPIKQQTMEIYLERKKQDKFLLE